VGLVLGLGLVASPAAAHRSGCHRWHSCPSDRGSYVCGDLGYPCRYPTYGTSGYRAPSLAGRPLAPTPSVRSLPSAADGGDGFRVTPGWLAAGGVGLWLLARRRTPPARDGGGGPR
jgi:hypothetical protein